MQKRDKLPAFAHGKYKYSVKILQSPSALGSMMKTVEKKN
jgi:hypothetical protein